MSETRRAQLSEAEQLLAESVESARAAGLHHVSDRSPGIHRIARRGKLHYIGPDGAEIHDDATLSRIDGLRIPPAWTHVWICRDARGHIQATGRDARGRKQYRYHARWREVRDATKFEKVLEFAKALPALREKVSADMASPTLSRDRVLATVVHLLDRTLIRVGNDEYAKQNGSYGLTTMRAEHVTVAGSEVVFHFRAKSGRERLVSLRDPRAARVIRRCQELPGQELFAYVDASGAVVDVTSGDVNAYLRDATGGEFTAKDFRTWAATVLAGLAIREICTGAKPPRSAERQIATAVKAVAESLGNTPAVCRKSYVHPVVLAAHEEGALLAVLEPMTRTDAHGLRPEEAAVLTFLEHRVREMGGMRATVAAPSRTRTTRGRAITRRRRGPGGSSRRAA